jgi:hypothetical protein
MLIRNAVDMFNSAYGLFADTWSAWAEGISNIALTLLLAPFMGISGILIAKIFSLTLFVLLWKPYYLFHEGLLLSVKKYWANIIKYYIFFILSFVLGHLLYRIIPIDDTVSFLTWIEKAICSIFPFSLVYFIVMCLFDSGMKNITNRFYTKLKNKK